MIFDATNFYPSHMWDEKSVYPKTESGFAFKPHLNDVYVEAFNIQTFNQDGNECAILKLESYSSPDLIFKQASIREKVNIIEVNRMRDGYIIYTSTKMANQKYVKIGGKVIEIYEGVFMETFFQISPFRKVIEKLFALTQNYKDERRRLWFNAGVSCIHHEFFVWCSNTQKYYWFL